MTICLCHGGICEYPLLMALFNRWLADGRGGTHPGGPPHTTRRKKRLTVHYIVEHPNQEGETCFDWTSQYCWTNGWNCLWRGHSVYRNRPLIPPPASDFAEHTDAVHSLCQHPELPLVVSGGEDDLAFLWQYPECTTKHVLRGHSDTVAACAFSFDGQVVVTGSLDGVIKLWDVESGTMQVELEGRACPGPLASEGAGEGGQPSVSGVLWAVWVGCVLGWCTGV